MSSRNPPPIPRKGVPANIQRARQQIANEKNRARAQAMVEKARANTQRRQGLTRAQEESVERAFQLRNEMDAMVLQEERRRARARVLAFQERQASADEVRRNIQESRRRGQGIREVADARSKIRQALASQEFRDEIAKEGVAGRRLGSGRETRDLANALFGGAGLQSVSEDFARKERERKERLKHTSLRPTKPEPEPEPEPQPEPEVFGTGVKGEPVPIPRGASGGRPVATSGAKAGGGFKLDTPPQPFLEPEPEPEFDPRQSRRKGE
tara:strand:+ start:727 stop:1530 length:804 start_codon:yes stop_codon:yes gene_type:complete